MIVERVAADLPSRHGKGQSFQESSLAWTLFVFVKLILAERNADHETGRAQRDMHSSHHNKNVLPVFFIHLSDLLTHCGPPRFLLSFSSPLYL